MQIGPVANAISDLFSRWFHKRNFIIVSEHKVKHISINGSVQFAFVLLLVGCVFWASYSTGNFIAARSVIKERTQALRLVTNAKVDNAFKNVFQVSGAQNNKRISTDPEIASLTAPLITPSALANNKIFTRIALLEHKVIELTNTNDAIVQRVREKTAQRIDEFESIIKQTGLNLRDLKKLHAKQEKKSNNPSGGPYIPKDAIIVWPHVDEMVDSLDELLALRDIVEKLPLSAPIKNARYTSRFGHRIDPFNKRLAFHGGLDMKSKKNARSKIYAPADGKVIHAGRHGAYGKAIDIDHGYGIVTRYGHLRTISVKKDQLIKKGELIGYEGSTGRSTGAHLHYEIRYHDHPINPRKFIEAGRYVSKK